MQVAKVAEKLRAQIQQFAGIFYPRFSRPKLRFLEQMLFGIAASQDCKLSQIRRALQESISLKKTEERIIWGKPGLGAQVQEQVVAQRRISSDTLIVIDPTDRAPYRCSAWQLASRSLHLSMCDKNIIAESNAG